MSEIRYFRKSDFFTLPKKCVGITSLRDRRSQLLFDHVKQKLPKLRKDLKEAFTDTQLLLDAMSDRRATPQECKAFLSQLSLHLYKIGKVAVNGHHEGEYFAHDKDETFSVESNTIIRKFSNLLCTRGYKDHIGERKEAKVDGEVTDKVKIDSEAVKIDVGPMVSAQTVCMQWRKGPAPF